MNAADIKIFVSCHKPSYVPENPMLFPIQVGGELAKVKMIHQLPGIFQLMNGI